MNLILFLDILSQSNMNNHSEKQNGVATEQLTLPRSNHLGWDGSYKGGIQKLRRQEGENGWLVKCLRL